MVELRYRSRSDIPASQHNKEASPKRDPPCGRALFSVSRYSCNIASYCRLTRTVSSLGSMWYLCCGMISHPYLLTCLLSQCRRLFHSCSSRGFPLFLIAHKFLALLSRSSATIGSPVRTTSTSFQTPPTVIRRSGMRLRFQAPGNASTL